MSRRSDLSARRLHQVPLRFRDRLVMGGSVFPLFDRQGTVRKLMVVWRASDRILLLDQTPGRIVPNWWGYTLDAAISEEGPLTRDRAAQVRRLWHFDPWLVLRHRRFAGHPAVAGLKQTNLPGGGGRTIQRLCYTRDLRRVASFSTERSGPLRPFDPALLPERSRDRTPSRPARTKGWRLRPVWILRAPRA